MQFPKAEDLYEYNKSRGWYTVKMETKPYLNVKEIEVIIRVDLHSMNPQMKAGSYDLQVDQNWIKVYISFPRINTSDKPLYRMEISSSDCQINKILRVYRRIAGNVKLLLRDSLNVVHEVDYCSVQKLNRFYATGEFYVSETNEMFPFQCLLMDGTKLKGCSKELKRTGKRWVYLDMTESTVRDCCKLLEAVEGGEVILEEIL